ncbi:MAG: hypothetical protein Q9212_004524 [Teloschistes hypoglaucus]
MAQPNVPATPATPATPAGRNRFTELISDVFYSMLALSGVTVYVSIQPIVWPLRPFAKRLYSPVPGEIIARRNKEEHRIVERIRPQGDDRCSNYMSLPAELRIQILENVLGTEAVWPYAGFTAHQQWRRDFEIATSARRHAWISRPTRSNFVFAVTMEEFFVKMTVLPIWWPPLLCVKALKTDPQVLSVCRTMFSDGLPLFIHGPLSTARIYYDKLPHAHRNLIRKLVLDISPMDLTVETFDEIESMFGFQKKATPGAPLLLRLCQRKRRIVSDKSSYWAREATTHIINIWRSKLEWLRTCWPSIGSIEITFFLTVPPRVRDEFSSLPPNFTIAGADVQTFLSGIRGDYPRNGPDDCYDQCDEGFADCMKNLEAEIGGWLEEKVTSHGWKCSKAYLREHAYVWVSEKEGGQERPTSWIW